MACYNSNCYLPQPPRAWSRVQNSCSLTTDADNNGFVTFPYTNNVVPVSALGEKLAMLNKGNVLQYKANSSNLTAAQRYSKIAKGQWVNRNTTWATQTERGYTNPNTTSLKRSGNIVNIALDPITGAIIGPTNAPPTCPQQIISSYIGLPSNISGSYEPEIPPPVEPTPASETFPPIIPDTPIEPLVIQDGGSLICSVQENICTGEITRSVSQQLCNPTTASDVPGPIQELCWNDGTPTWYPHSRYIMTNSTNKWPVNAKLVSAVKPLPPIIISVSTLNNTKDTATITWTHNSKCLPATQFIIFNNTSIATQVDGNIFTTTIYINIDTINRIYMFAQIGDIVSDISNIVYIPDNLNNLILNSSTNKLLPIDDNKQLYTSKQISYIEENTQSNFINPYTKSLFKKSNNEFNLENYSNIILRPLLTPSSYLVPSSYYSSINQYFSIYQLTNNHYNSSPLESILMKLYNTVGKDLLVFTDKYSLGLTTELAETYTYDIYSRLVKAVFNSSFTSSKGYSHLREIVMDAIEGLNQNVLQTVKYNAEISKLQNIISQLKSNKEPSILNEHVTLSLIAEIRPEIIEYIKQYGYPSGGVFDTEILGEIINNLFPNNNSTKNEMDTAQTF